MPLLPDIVKRLTGLPKGTVVNPLQQELVAQVTGGNTISDQLGPGVTPKPLPLDMSWLPRAMFYRPGWNLQANPDTDRRIGYQTLRDVADLYDLLRKAIEIRKDELAGLGWDLVPVTGTTAEKREKMRAARKKIDAFRDFMDDPARDTLGYQTWLRKCVEEVVVPDALSISKRLTLGGKLHSLELIDGTLVRPQLNLQGRVPEPPDPAYVQVIAGVNRFSWTRDELIFRPKTVRIWTPYGFSPVEQFLMLVNLALRHRSWVTAVFTDGNIPQALLSAPEGWSREQIEDLMALRDQIRAGDPRFARVLEMMPHGVETIIQNGGDAYLQFGSEIANFIIDLTCVCMDVTRQELGLEPGNSEGLGGSGHAEAQQGVHFRRSLLPLANWFADVVFSPLLREFDLKGFKWIWPDLSEEDAAAKADLLDKKVRSGQISFDDMQLEAGAEPQGVGYLFDVGGQLLGIQDLKMITEKGWMAYQAEQEKQKATNQNELQKDLESHKAGLQQQQSEHESELQRDQADDQVELEHAKQEAHVEGQRQIAEHAHHLMIRDAAFRHELERDQAEHAHGLEMEAADQAHEHSLDQAEHGADLQADQTDQQHTLALAQQAHQSGLETARQADQLAAQHGYSLHAAEHAHGLEQQSAEAQHERDLDMADHQAQTQLGQLGAQHGYALDQATHQSVLQAGQQADQHRQQLDLATHNSVLQAGQQTDQHRNAMDLATHNSVLQTGQARDQHGLAKDLATHNAGLQRAGQREQLSTQHRHRMEEQGAQRAGQEAMADRQHGHRIDEQSRASRAQASMADRQHGHKLEEAALAAKLAPKRPVRKAAIPASVDRFLGARGYRVEVDPSFADRDGERLTGTLDYAAKAIRLYADADDSDLLTLAAQALSLELDNRPYHADFVDLTLKYAEASDPEAFFCEALAARAAGASLPPDLDAYYARLERELERACA